MKVQDQTEGKYYATDLAITLDDGRVVLVEISSSDPEPSYIEKQENEGIEDAYCDGHYEREATRIVADRILEWNR